MPSRTHVVGVVTLSLALAGSLAPAAADAAPAHQVRPVSVRNISVRTAPAGRVLPVPGTVNARDTGGYLTYDGKRTRWGVLYRSESLAKIPADGTAALAALGLGSVLDLRTAPEIRADGADRLPAGVTSVPDAVDDTGLYAFIGQAVLSRDPAYQQALLGDGRARARMISLYRGFVTNPANRAALGTAVRAVSNSSKPVLFHCSAGKDRTGVLADTVLRAVGVPAATSEQDYLLSGPLRAASDQALRDQLKAAGYMQDPGLLIPLQQVSSDYLGAFRDQAVQDYGSFGNFLTDGLGLDASTLLRLRIRLVG
ncbi:tyrosine-protein phosphatase [Streptomyces actinomycinicus]|uniref:Tyrosine-protein phosphatase n=1 Tax=Streptomyces actinomycinicus TaxID=1695166 RepID=A0A937EEG2_9ACTN|nr:tyrosine-protein phosphatase [Streptomyces actinomycinicus]MBL1081038.1 tyrosine-protein phosphatase [Streptomyces actinomycinicus]